MQGKPIVSMAAEGRRRNFVVNRAGFRASGALIVMLLFAASAAWADSLTDITSAGAQGANDSTSWSQLGADATELGTSFSATSAQGISVSGGFAGSTPTSLIAVACTASPCSWSGGTSGSTPFSGGDSLIWTANAGSSGNGPVTLTLGSSVSGAGALIQEDAPGQFTAEIQVFNGVTSLGSYSENSDSNGDPVYIGVKDTSGTNINKVVFSIVSTTNTDGDVTDFALDTMLLNDSPAATATATFTPTVGPTPTGVATPTMTATVTPTMTAMPTSLPTVAAALGITPVTGNFGNGKIGKLKMKKFHLKNLAKKGGPSITLSGASVPPATPQVFGFPSSSANTCFNGTVLPPGKHCVLVVGFAPATPGFQSSTMTVEDNADNAPQSVPLAGTGK